MTLTTLHPYHHHYGVSFSSSPSSHHRSQHPVSLSPSLSAQYIPVTITLGSASHHGHHLAIALTTLHLCHHHYGASVSSLPSSDHCSQHPTSLLPSLSPPCIPVTVTLGSASHHHTIALSTLHPCHCHSRVSISSSPSSHHDSHCPAFLSSSFCCYF